MVASPMRHYRKIAGLTLIEVLVALAIVGIAMTAIIKAASQNIRSTHYLQNKTTALWVGQNLLNEARLGLIPEQENTKTTSMLGRDWYSQIEFKETPNKRIKKITVNVSDHEDLGEDEAPLVSLEGYLYEGQ